MDKPANPFVDPDFSADSPNPFLDPLFGMDLLDAERDRGVAADTAHPTHERVSGTGIVRTEDGTVLDPRDGPLTAAAALSVESNPTNTERKRRRR